MATLQRNRRVNDVGGYLRGPLVKLRSAGTDA